MNQHSNNQTLANRQQGTLVGVGDMKVGVGPEGRIITHALGSCIGLTVFDPKTNVGGLLHFMLPGPAREGAMHKPFMYAMTGIPDLFKAAYAAGASKSRLVVCAAGGAEILKEGSSFDIGRRNRTMMRKLFWKSNVVLVAEDTGGSTARTMELCLQTGRVTIKSKGEVRALWPR